MSTLPIAIVPASAPDAGPSFYDSFHPAVEIRFEFPVGFSTVPVEAAPGLDLVIASLKEWPRRVHVNGDSAKGEAPTLALARAKAIAAELSKRGATSLIAETRAHDDRRSVTLFEDDLGAFAIAQHLFEACCRNLMTSSVHLTFDNQRADSQLGRDMYAREEAQCKACSGRWGPRGFGGFPGCDCKFDDGGKPCSSPRDCKGRCDLGWEGAMQKHGTTCAKGAATCALQGTCEEYNAPFGCHGWIDEDKAGTRGTKWICVD